MASVWTLSFFFARVSPANWDWLKLLSLKWPTSLISAALKVALGRALPPAGSKAASTAAINSAASTPAVTRFVLKKTLLLRCQQAHLGRANTTPLGPLLRDKTRRARPG